MPVKPAEFRTLAGDACLTDGAVLKRLRSELSHVEDLLRKKSQGGCSGQGAAALIRLVKGVSSSEWDAFAAEYGLDDWMHIALGEGSDDLVDRFLSSLEVLIFQRDHDALTGLGNRRFFDVKLEAEFERAVRSQTELSLLFIDIDDFKKLNDTYGHACGDQLLQRLGDIMRTSFRPYDIPCRIGGEEFSVILPATSGWTGVLLGNRLLERFREEKFSCANEDVFSTFSCGVASLNQLAESELTPAILLQYADKALYAAKRSGKNRVTLAQNERGLKDRQSLVQAEEKLLLFAPEDPERDVK